MPTKVKIEGQPIVVEKEADINVAGAAASLSAAFTSLAAPPVHAVLEVQVAPIRFTLKAGVVPTAASGFRADPNDTIVLDEENEIANFQYILESGSPVIHYAFYRPRSV